jgi:tRNA dimethylallyltransferase
MNKLVVILGPTSTGKTSLAIKLCKKFSARGGGEIVSADSRQVYKFMDIGTGKMPAGTGTVPVLKRGDGVWTVDDVKIHLYDVVEPNKNFSVARFKDAAEKEIQSIWRRKKVPFLVGGTGFYIAAVLGESETAGVSPNWELRRQLEKLSVEELFEKLQRLDPKRSESIDRFNSRRLVRAIEIALAGASPKLSPDRPEPRSVLKIGLTAPREVLYQRADSWAEAIVSNGLIDEVKDLIRRGYKDAPPMNGIIYKTAIEFVDGKISKDEMRQRIKFDLHGYIRRQLTWFRKDKKINWLDITRPDFDPRTQKLVELFLNDE